MDFNPSTPLKKGMEAIKVAMEHLTPYGKKIRDWEISNFNGGTKFQNGDTLVARITPCLENGKIGYVDILKDGEVAFGSTEFIVLREKQGISVSQFIFYFAYWNEFRDLAIQLMTGSSGRQRVETDVLKNKVFNLPPLPEQRAIADVLSCLDDKIDLLHRQNKTLEAMAEALFRRWFVEEGEEEWEMGKFGDEFDFTMGASPPGESYNEDAMGIPMYQGNADFGFRFPTNRVFTTDPKRFAEKYDTLISVRAPVGAQNMSNEKCCIGRGVAAFRYKNNPSFYTYTYYKLKSLMDEIKQFNETGTVFGSISKNDFESIEITIPKKELIFSFQEKVKNMDDKIYVNTNQIRTLTQLRDTLLPKLMSGEVRVE